jgi:hypothetical protein
MDSPVTCPALAETVAVDAFMPAPELPSHLSGHWFDHPLMQLFRPPVATRAIEALADAINSALDAAYRGLCVYGFARHGKTEALDYLAAHRSWIPARRPAVILSLDAPNTSKRTDTTFYQALLTAFRVPTAARATNATLGDTLTTYFIERALNANCRLVMLFIDEAQYLHPSDSHYLVLLDNALRRHGFCLFVVLAHQRDLTGYSNESVADLEYPPHVHGRFRVRQHELCGLRDEGELAYALSRYDEGTEWPSGSGVSFTEFFAGDAFRQRDFRLAHYAARLWRLARDMRAQARLPEAWTWPMKSFESTVVHLLTSVLPRRGPTFDGFTDEELVEALWFAGLVELEKSRSTYQSKGGV